MTYKTKSCINNKIIMNGDDFEIFIENYDLPLFEGLYDYTIWNGYIIEKGKEFL